MIVITVLLSMGMLGIGIALLVLYRRYSHYQTTSIRKAISVLTILQTVFTSVVTFEAIGTIVAILFVAEILTFFEAASQVVAFIGVLYAIMPCVLIAFAIVTMVFGYKAMNNRTWRYNAEFNSSISNGRYSTINVWLCPCGKQNKGLNKFCPACGKPKGTL